MSLFEVKNKITGKIITIYSIDRLEKYPKTEFLCYDDNKFRWMDSDNFKPYHKSYSDMMAEAEEYDYTIFNKEGKVKK